METFDIAQAIQRVAIMMPVFLFALVIHEYAHAWVANKFGDNTSEWQGRLTLNPAAHIDPIGTIALPMISIVFGGIFFGWAKPVPIDPRRFSNYRKGLFWVSSAGPLSNIIFGFISAFLYVGFLAKVSPANGFYDAGKQMLEALMMINFSLAIFNLIPLPPLDGSNIVLSFLSASASRKYLEIQQYSFFILLALMFTGAIRVISIPIILLANISVNLASHAFGFASLL